MCGIAGIVDQAPAPVLTRQLRKMLDWQIARGPDGAGEHCQPGLAMGMRRLSVIDLEHGQQPAQSIGGRVLAFQNGEIYNYRELQRTLAEHGHRFSSQCDTEVLAHGYAQWGMDGLLQRLDGMFAMAILDQRDRTLHLARDRFGEKPLFYAAAGHRFAWSSNLLTLAALPWVDISIDLQAQDDYLALHYVSGPRTMFKGVRRLLPGHRLSLSLDRPEPAISRYFTQKLQPNEPVSDTQLERCLQHAVESRLVADVPVGIFLSGGLDSSMVAAMAAARHKGIRTFSMGFDSANHDESRHARRVAEHIGSHHHEFQFRSASFDELLPKVAMALDEPIGDQATLPLYWLSREASEHVTVVLSGEGADEIFGGYGYYRQFARSTFGYRVKMRLKGLEANAAPLDTLTRNAQPMTPSGFPLLADLHDRQMLASSSFDRDLTWECGLINWMQQSPTGLDRAMATDLATWLPDDLLVKFDRMTMAHSLEGRAPYLQSDLVGMALTQLRTSDRIGTSGSKLALTRIARKWLPNAILQRRKQGFVLPMREWLKSWFQKHGGAREYFLPRSPHSLDIDQLVKIVDEDISRGIQRERLLFALVMYAEWHHRAMARLDCGQQTDQIAAVRRG